MPQRPVSLLIAVASLMGSYSARAQASIAPSNPHQERCIEAVDWQETAPLKALGISADDPVARRKTLEELAIEKFGSFERMHPALQRTWLGLFKKQLQKLSKGARAGHLPSIHLLMKSYEHADARYLEGNKPKPEERLASYRVLHQHGFPLAAMRLAEACFGELEDMPEHPDEIEAPRPKCTIRALWIDQGPYGPPNAPPPNFCTEDELAEFAARRQAHWDAREAEKARLLAKIAAKREASVDLMREGGFRGDTDAWERLAQIINPVLSADGLVPPVEHYAWLELEKLDWRQREWEDEHSVPRMHQDELIDKFLSEDELRQARALAERYAEKIWPRRIPAGNAHVCRLMPQFVGDTDPYAADLLPR